MIVFDLDGTLSIVGDRVKYLQQNPKDWNAFYEACDEDKPNEPVCKIYKSLAPTYKEAVGMIILTGRRESAREKTEDWLEYEGIHFDELIMRPDGDTRHDTILKPELLGAGPDEVEMIFEDRNSMVKKWRELGYVCVQVADGDF